MYVNRIALRMAKTPVGILLLLLTIVLSSCSSQADSGSQNAVFDIKRGTNVAHWLSQSNKRGVARDTFFTAEDVKRIAALGFDHIRLPVDEEQLWKENGEKDSVAFSLLHNAIQWCEEQGLKIVVDLHILRSHHFNDTDIELWKSEEAQQRFITCWEDLSDELSSYPNDVVAYELLNEPNAADPEDLNRLLHRGVKAIREREPERFIVLGSNDKQKAYTFAYLDVPADDPRLILSFHLYDPMLLTHYQASWVDTHPYTGTVHYPGQSVSDEDMAALQEPLKTMVANRNQHWDFKALETRISEALKFREQTGLALYCGEFGAITNAPAVERTAWYQDLCRLMEKHEIAYANWNYKSDNFGIINTQNEERSPAETEAMTGQARTIN